MSLPLAHHVLRRRPLPPSGRSTVTLDSGDEWTPCAGSEKSGIAAPWPDTESYGEDDANAEGPPCASGICVRDAANDVLRDGRANLNHEPCLDAVGGRLPPAPRLHVLAGDQNALKQAIIVCLL